LHQLLAWSAEFKTWYLGSLETGGYPLVLILMAMESSIVPIPAEAVVPQAAYLASIHPAGRMHPVGVLIAATLGSWIGATVMYWASRWAGRPLVLRFGRLVLIPPSRIEQAERWSARFGHIGVFISRLLPVMRHLIGIPSGILRLNFLKYSAYTLAGSLIWCAVLTGVGVYAGNNPELLRGDLRTLTLGIAAAALVLGSLYYFLVHRPTRVAEAVKH
jgi:membrane protein DedA with SNARE-associated domain